MLLFFFQEEESWSQSHPTGALWGDPWDQGRHRALSVAQAYESTKTTTVSEENRFILKQGEVKQNAQNERNLR